MFVYKHEINYSLEIIESIEDTANSRAAFQALIKDPKYNISDSFDANISERYITISFWFFYVFKKRVIVKYYIVNHAEELMVILRMQFVRVKWQWLDQKKLDRQTANGSTW